MTQANANHPIILGPFILAYARTYYNIDIYRWHILTAIGAYISISMIDELLEASADRLWQRERFQSDASEHAKKLAAEKADQRREIEALGENILEEKKAK